ncbi:MAG TPA: UDP-3-O-(3-hydroxymyristoyl)glucosamine N-acyltransferase, partial [Pirellulaceae bacterium]
MTLRLSELADLVGGVLSGDGGIEITGADVLTCAGPGQITLADRPQLLERLAQSRASAAVVPTELCPEGKAFIAVPNVREAFARIVARFKPQRGPQWEGVSPLAFVSESARLEAGVTIYPHAFVGQNVIIGPGTTLHAGVTILDGCRLGSGVTVFPRAVLYEDTIVGDHTIIHANAVLGAYGFGYELVDGQHVLSAQLGNVELGDHVEVGAGTTIDRGTFGPTRIGSGTKIDNLVMIGHNCQIGRHNLLCGQVGIAGSCATGDYVVMGGQVGV